MALCVCICVVSGQWCAPYIHHLTPRVPCSRGLSEPVLKTPQQRELWDAWRSTWLMAWERQRRLQDKYNYSQEMEKLQDFDFEDWRKRVRTDRGAGPLVCGLCGWQCPVLIVGLVNCVTGACTVRLVAPLEYLPVLTKAFNVYQTYHDYCSTSRLKRKYCSLL